MDKTSIFVLSSISLLTLGGIVWYYLDKKNKENAQQLDFLSKEIEANKNNNSTTAAKQQIEQPKAATVPTVKTATKALTSYDVLSGQANKTIPSGTNIIVINSATASTLANQLHENFIYLDKEPYSKDFYNAKILDIIKNIASKADLYEVAKKYDTSYNKNTFKAKSGSKYDNLYNRLYNMSNWSNIDKSILVKTLYRF